MTIAAQFTRPSSGPSLSSAALIAAAIDVGSAGVEYGRRTRPPWIRGRSHSERVRANVGQRDAGAFGGQHLGGCVTYATTAGVIRMRRPHVGSMGNFANRQWRVRWAGEELADGNPPKGFRRRS